LKEFLKTTIIGGTSFLLPAALVVFILSYALRLVKRVAAPISNSLHLDQLGDLAGIGAATVLSILVLVLISFVQPALLLAAALASFGFCVQAHHGAICQFATVHAPPATTVSSGGEEPEYGAGLWTLLRRS
jgi:hypothetical protein